MAPPIRCKQVQNPDFFTQERSTPAEQYGVSIHQFSNEKTIFLELQPSALTSSTR